MKKLLILATAMLLGLFVFGASTAQAASEPTVKVSIVQPHDAYYCPGPGAHYWQRAGPWVYYLECRVTHQVCDFWVFCYNVWQWVIVAQYYDPSGYYG